MKSINSLRRERIAEYVVEMSKNISRKPVGLTKSLQNKLNNSLDFSVFVEEIKQFKNIIYIKIHYCNENNVNKTMDFTITFKD